ncbi:hypothetical protein ABJY88_14595, partial [Vibrio parahaemolyticus]|uniref:hypothetical protein n=1 Tax=Vibrio parahaemolyticus TaxID=670 RepID=UPI0032AFB290
LYPRFARMKCSCVAGNEVPSCPCRVVYSVMHPTDEQLAKSVKGISEASASKIRAAIDEKIVQPWERENWTKEQVNEVRRK